MEYNQYSIFVLINQGICRKIMQKGVGFMKMDIRGKNILTIVICAIFVIGGAIAIYFTTNHRIDDGVKAKADSISQLTNKSYEDYEAALITYHANLKKHQDLDDTMPGIVLPDDMNDITQFPGTLEDAGLDPENIIQDEDGTYIYLIQNGDTLTQLSAAFGYSVDQIANFNQIRDVNLIYANSVLRIPE